jgi:hypothetical protein
MSGSDLTLSGPFLNDFHIASDTTGEDTALLTSLNPDQLIALEEFPVSNLVLVPQPGIPFQISFSKNPGLSFTAFANADGVANAGTILNNLNNQFAGVGLGFYFPIVDQNSNQVIGYRTQFFDPSSVAIAWNGSTGLDLATFGLGVESTPEPGTFWFMLVAPATLALRLFRPLRSATSVAQRAPNADIRVPQSSCR